MVVLDSLPARMRVPNIPTLLLGMVLNAAKSAQLTWFRMSARHCAARPASVAITTTSTSRSTLAFCHSFVMRALVLVQDSLARLRLPSYRSQITRISAGTHHAHKFSFDSSQTKQNTTPSVLPTLIGRISCPQPAELPCHSLPGDQGRVINFDRLHLLSQDKCDLIGTTLEEEPRCGYLGPPFRT